MKMLPTLCASLALAVSATLPMRALAYDPACDFGTPAAFRAVAAEFTGYWRMEHLAGFAWSPAFPMVLPFGADEPRPPVTIYQSGDALYVNSPMNDEDLRLAFDTGPTRGFEAGFEASGRISGLVPWSLVEESLGCGVDSLARLTGQAVVIEGPASMLFTYRLIPTGTNSMYGIMQLDGTYEGQPVHMFRSVTMTKVGPLDPSFDIPAEDD
jgi:hypothetical protein